MKAWSDIKPFVATRQFLGRRSRQQDRSIVVAFVNERGEDGVLVVMADGHSFDGDHAADTAAARIMDCVLEAGDRGAETFRQAFLGAHDLLVRDKVDGGTTATCVSVHTDAIVAAWVGNSEARIVRADGTLKTLTVPHEFGVHRGETARLDALGAAIMGRDDVRSLGGYGEPRFPARPRRGHVQVGNAFLEVTRVLGDPEFDKFVLHEPEIASHAPAPEDRWLLVATDGVWHAAKRTSKRRRIGEALSGCATAEAAASALEALLGRWKLDDNATFALVDLACMG